jgi:cytochrome c peroxidase
VDVIFKEALAEWRALPPPTLNGQPPILQGTGYQAVELLGKLLNNDRNMSVGRDVACSSCHVPYTGFTTPIPSINLGPVAMPGSMHFRWGKRKPQSYTYATYFPQLEYNAVLKSYRPLFELVWGEGSLDIKWPADTEAICSTPEGAAVFNGSKNALHHHLTRSSGSAPARDAVAMPVALDRDD